MFNLLFLASFLLFVLTAIASVLYYKRIRGLSEKYEEARDVMGDIILSFNSQLRGCEEKLDAVFHKTEALSSSHERTRHVLEEHDEQLKRIATKVKGSSRGEQQASAQIDDVNRRIERLVASQETIIKKLAEVEKLGERISVAPEAERVKIEAPIPIKREKALAPLTETELRVLKILADDSPRTAPEIREDIKLTREHTARLMKKLYQEGYLERSVHKIPYTYRIKREMLKILKKRA